MATTYTTRSEDVWDLISFRIYNTSAYRSNLIDANPSYVSTMIFDSGTVLNVPTIATTNTIDLPPWMLGYNLGT